MKVIYLTNVDIEKINGASVHIKAFTRYFPTDTSDCEVFSYKGEKCSINNILFYISSLFFIILRFNEFDILYVRYFPFCYLQILIARIMDKPVFIEYNAVVEEEMKSHNKKKRVSSIVRFISKISARMAKGIIVLSRGIGHYIKEEYKIPYRDIHVSSNGGYILEQKIFSVKRRGVIAINHIAWYDLTAIIDIKNRLKQQNIGLDVYVSGMGQCESDYDIIRDEKIDYKFYDFGLIMIDENYGRDKFKFGVRPIKYFEYLANGLITIVPDISDINAITVNNCTGYIHSGDRQSIINVLLSMYEDENKMDQMQENAYKLIGRQYDWKRLSKSIEHFINGILR